MDKTTQDRIEAEAKHRGKNHMFVPMDGDYSSYEFHGFIVERSYIAGATAEHAQNESVRLQLEAQDANVEILLGQKKELIERAQVPVDALEEIANSPVPANEREMQSWIETARTLVSSTLEQWKEKEVGDDNYNESINALRRATGCAKELAEKAVRFSINFEEQINYVKTNGPKF